MTAQPRPLTVIERKALNAIRAYIEENGYPPSMRELGKAIGLSSTSTVFETLRRLQVKGYIRRDPNWNRAVVILDPPTVQDGAA